MLYKPRDKLNFKISNVLGQTMLLRVLSPSRSHRNHYLGWYSHSSCFCNGSRHDHDDPLTWYELKDAKHNDCHCLDLIPTTHYSICDWSCDRLHWLQCSPTMHCVQMSRYFWLYLLAAYIFSHCSGDWSLHKYNNPDHPTRHRYLLLRHHVLLLQGEGEWEEWRSWWENCAKWRGPKTSQSKRAELGGLGPEIRRSLKSADAGNNSKHEMRGLLSLSESYLT